MNPNKLMMDLQFTDDQELLAQLITLCLLGKKWTKDSHNNFQLEVEEDGALYDLGLAKLAVLVAINKKDLARERRVFPPHVCFILKYKDDKGAIKPSPIAALITGNRETGSVDRFEYVLTPELEDFVRELNTCAHKNDVERFRVFYNEVANIIKK